MTTDGSNKTLDGWLNRAEEIEGGFPDPEFDDPFDPRDYEMIDDSPETS